jgi:hypothetical protein
MSTKWKWLSDATYHWKGHVVNDDLVHVIEGDLYDRAKGAGHDSTFVIQDQTDEVYFDLPGMCLIERAHRTIDLDGLQLRIPSQDFETVLAQVRLLEERQATVGDETLTYYKLHGWRFCIVLSVAERERLIGEMECQREAAEVEGDADNQRFVKALDGLPVVSARAEAIKRSVAGNEGAN